MEGPAFAKSLCNANIGQQCRLADRAVSSALKTSENLKKKN